MREAHSLQFRVFRLGLLQDGGCRGRGRGRGRRLSEGVMKSISDYFLFADHRLGIHVGPLQNAATWDGRWHFRIAS
jgi:hypothetical protein